MRETALVDSLPDRLSVWCGVPVTFRYDDAAEDLLQCPEALFFTRRPVPYPSFARITCWRKRRCMRREFRRQAIRCDFRRLYFLDCYGTDSEAWGAGASSPPANDTARRLQQSWHEFVHLYCTLLPLANSVYDLLDGDIDRHRAVDPQATLELATAPPCVLELVFLTQGPLPEAALAGRRSGLGDRVRARLKEVDHRRRVFLQHTDWPPRKRHLDRLNDADDDAYEIWRDFLVLVRHTLHARTLSEFLRAQTRNDRPAERPFDMFAALDADWCRFHWQLAGPIMGLPYH